MRPDAARQELRGLYQPPVGDVGPEEEEQYWVPLGFTVYRTDYSPGTDTLWDELIADLEMRLKDSIGGKLGYEDDVPVDDDVKAEKAAVEELLSRVRIDARSDKSLFEGLDDERLRQIFLNATENKPLNQKPRGRRIFLVADSMVFRRLGVKLP